MFVEETDCTYYFNWQTAYACVKEKEDLLCRVQDGSRHYDLSPLTRYPGECGSSLNLSEIRGISHLLFVCPLVKSMADVMISLSI